MADVRRAFGPDLPDAGSVDAYQTLAWFENLAAHGIDWSAADLLALTLRPAAGGKTLLSLPLMRCASGAAAPFGPVLSGLSNYYSSLFGPIGPGTAVTVPACRALLRALRRSAPDCGVIDLKPLDADGSFLQCMQQALREEGYAVDRYFCFGNWHHPLAGQSFAQYFERVPSRIRNTIRRGQKKLEDTRAWELEIVCRDDQDLERAMADFDAVYRRSWKVPEPFPEFVPSLIRTAQRQGWLRLGVVRVDGAPIAAQLWLVRNGHALIYKLAYDETHKRFSAGSVLTAALMRHVIDTDRVVDIDYLTGDDAYKADWMSLRRERVGLVAFNPLTAQGLAGASRHWGARWWRSIRPPRPPAGATATAAPASMEAVAHGD